MITTKEINLNFNNGSATANINIYHLVKKISVVALAVDMNDFMINYVIKAPLLLPNSDDIIYGLYQDFSAGGLNRSQTSIRHIFRNPKPINGTYTFQVFSLDNILNTGNIGATTHIILVVQFSDE